MAEGGDSKRIFLVTARHVVFPPNTVDNNMYEHVHPAQPRHNVLLLGDSAFKKLLASIRMEIGNAASTIGHQERRLEAAEEMEGEEVEREREDAQAIIDEAEQTLREYPLYCQVVLKYWGAAGDRVLGHVLYAPPIGVCAIVQYTEDFAIIEFDSSKIDAKNFKETSSTSGLSLRPKISTA